MLPLLLLKPAGFTLIVLAAGAGLTGSLHVQSSSNTSSCWSWQTASSPTWPTRGRPSFRLPTSPCPSSSLGSGTPTSATCRCWTAMTGSCAHPKESPSSGTSFSSSPSATSNTWVHRVRKLYRVRATSYTANVLVELTHNNWLWWTRVTPAVLHLWPVGF